MLLSPQPGSERRQPLERLVVALLVQRIELGRVPFHASHDEGCDGSEHEGLARLFERLHSVETGVVVQPALAQRATDSRIPSQRQARQQTQRGGALPIALVPREHDNVSRVAIADGAVDGDGVADAPVEVPPSLDLDRWREYRQAAGGSMHSVDEPARVVVVVAEVARPTGGAVCRDHHERPRRTSQDFVVERRELVGECPEQEAHAEPATLADEVRESRVAAIGDEFHEDPVVALALAYEVVGPGVCSGRYADDVIDGYFVVEERVEDSRGVGAAHAAPLEHQADPGPRAHATPWPRRGRSVGDAAFANRRKASSRSVCPSLACPTAFRRISMLRS